MIDHTEEDMDLVAVWLRKDPKRWVAGAMAGLFAGAVMMLFAMVLSVALGAEAWFPIKIAALPFLGGAATEYGVNVQAIVIGAVFHEFIAMVLGIVYAHFTGTNSLPSLLGAGVVWGLFSWIFITNLFCQSFKDVFAAHIPVGAAFPVNLVFGLALTSVAFFDRALRGSRA
jgi:hypothetical protein